MSMMSDTIVQSTRSSLEIFSLGVATEPAGHGNKCGVALGSGCVAIEPVWRGNEVVALGAGCVAMEPVWRGSEVGGVAINGVGGLSTPHPPV